MSEWAGEPFVPTKNDIDEHAKVVAALAKAWSRNIKSR
jgi:hypothetical protein